MAQEAFNAFALEYDNAKYLLEPAKRTAENAGHKKGQKVLDVACGTGWATMAAANLVGDTGFVTGIDIADQLLTLARAKATATGLKNIEYLRGNAESLEFDDNTFDTVTCASSLFIFQDPTKALCEWYRVLKPGGNVIFSVFGEEIFLYFIYISIN
jgi:arsenite methyltransferase